MWDWVTDETAVVAKLGLDPATAIDDAHLADCVAAANTHAAGSPYAGDPLRAAQVHAGATALAAWLYQRRPAGMVQPPFEFQPADDSMTLVWLLLGYGRHAPPVTA